MHSERIQRLAGALQGHTQRSQLHSLIPPSCDLQARVLQLPRRKQQAATLPRIDPQPCSDWSSSSLDSPILPISSTKLRQSSSFPLPAPPPPRACPWPSADSRTYRSNASFSSTSAGLRCGRECAISAWRVEGAMSKGKRGGLRQNTRRVDECMHDLSSRQAPLEHAHEA